MVNNSSIDTRSIGRRLRNEREKLGLSRESFAEILGLSSYYVGQLERGERQMSLLVTVKICDCLRISLDYLVMGKTNYNSIYAAPQDEGVIKHMTGEDLEDADRYDTAENTEIKMLLDKCSPQELELINKLIKTILPYLKR